VLSVLAEHPRLLGSSWEQVHRIDVEDGRLLASITLGKTSTAQVVAVDVDTDGHDEYPCGA